MTPRSCACALIAAAGWSLILNLCRPVQSDAQEPDRIPYAVQLVPYPPGAGPAAAFRTGPDGRLYVSFPTEGLVRSWEDSGWMEASGRIVREPLREFPRQFGWLRGRPWAVDRDVTRVAWLDSSWRLVDSARVVLPGRTGELYVRGLLGVVGHDSLLIETTASGFAMALAGPERAGLIERLPGPLAPGATVASAPVWITSAGGTVLDTVVRLSTLHRLAVLFSPDERGPEGVQIALAAEPFGDYPLLAVDPTSSHLVVVDRHVRLGPPPTYTIHRLGLTGDTIRTLSQAYRPIPMLTAWLDHAAAKEGVRLSDDVDRGAEAAGAALFTPPWLPPVSHVEVGPRGWIWLRREAVPSQEQVPWEVWTGDDHRLGSISLPSDWSIEAVYENVAWAVSQSGTPSRQLWRIRIGEGEMR